MPTVDGAGSAAGLSDVQGRSDFSSAPSPYAGAGAAAGTSTATAASTSQGVGAASGAAAATGGGASTSIVGAGSAAGAATASGVLSAAITQTSVNPKNYLLRVRETRLGANGIVEFDLVREDLSIYDGLGESPLLGADLSGGAEAPPEDDGNSSDNSRPGSTRLMLLDIPQLMAEHSTPGFYAAASGASDGWAGAVLYRKDGDEYIQIAQLAERAIIGRADTKLQSGDVTLFDDAGRTYQYDDANTVTVTLIDSISELASVSDANVEAGINIAAIGQHGRWEIIGFGTVEQLSERKFRLSHLLRGLKGTEWAVDQHQSGDQFVVLNVALRRITDEFADIGVKRRFRAVSVGGVFESASDRSFTESGVSLKPLAPVYIRGEEDADNNRVIRFWDRSRYDGMAGRDGTDSPPPDETLIRYEVDIYNSAGTAVVRTITALGEATGYSAAQQAADFGAVPSSLIVKIYKISGNDAIGRGYAGEATLSSFGAIVDGSAGTGRGIYDVHVSIPGPQRHRRITITLVRTVMFRAGLDGSWARTSAPSPDARPVAAATSEYSLQKNGVEIGTATFAAGANSASIDFADDVFFIPGVDTFELVEPAVVDTTLRDVGFGFAGERV